ncbi:MAG: DUF2852 domain-containing protein [Acetobacteraceae bacterium]
MAGSEYQGAYGNPAWGAAPGPSPSGQAGWGQPRWPGPGPGAGWRHDRWSDGFGPPPWYPARAGRFLPIAAMILGFIFWWPVGLAILGYLIWSGRMGCWSRRGGIDGSADRWQGRRGRWGGWTPWSCDRNAEPPGSGNRAFDEYRADTLRRLEEEQQEFAAFLDRLRFAKDKAEFDQFMTERRRTPPAPPDAPEVPPAG